MRIARRRPTLPVKPRPCLQSVQPLPTSHERQNPPAFPRRSHDRMARSSGDASLTGGAHRHPCALRQQRDKPSAFCPSTLPSTTRSTSSATSSPAKRAAASEPRRRNDGGTPPRPPERTAGQKGSILPFQLLATKPSTVSDNYDCPLMSRPDQGLVESRT